MSTQELLLAWRDEGQEAAFEALFEQYHVSIYRVLYRMVGGEAEDLVQETFLRLYQRPPWQEDTDVGAWLYRVATRLGYAALRGRQRWEKYRDHLAENTDGVGWQGESVNPETALEHREAQRAVQATLRTLSRRQACLLVLRYEGLRYREIATVIGVSPNSVGTLLARAERAFGEAYRRITAGGT
ncbi:MAG: sigma-70 family RNA polymerase sigma factor [Chloroflexota bacterium]|nr:sigma-70 family RNA polymerase sigma factor [Chloroflexota bacterium]